MLHPHVIFVGDRPNVKKCLDINVPFVGCPSYKTLLEWVYRLDVDISETSLVNAYDASGFRNTRLNSFLGLGDVGFFNNIKIIALGQNAADRLAELQLEQIAPLKYFQLPHPSGLNRVLNDKEEITRILTKCKKFIHDK